VVYRRVAGGIEIALGEQCDRLTGAHNVRLPKGRVDAGETLEQAALREVAEETGLSARVVAPLGQVAYVYREGKGEVSKRVHYFLMELASERVGPADGELERIVWCPIENAERWLSFDTERAVARRAREQLEA
jgi:8-oxo-dGTP pyrophosphatase MutT (NUDIX family)